MRSSELSAVPAQLRTGHTLADRARKNRANKRSCVKVESVAALKLGLSGPKRRGAGVRARWGELRLWLLASRPHTRESALARFERPREHGI